MRFGARTEHTLIMLRWGIDLGGTKIEGVILEDDSIEPVARYRVPTEYALGYDHVLRQVERLVLELESRTGLSKPEKIGMGCPGSTDPITLLLRNCNATTLNGHSFQQDLSVRLGVDIRLSNDANCFALAEATLGAGKGCEVVFGVILGSGVGGGLVVNGKVLGGANGIAGEWGHNPIDPEGRVCYCGRTGCIETVLGGPHLENWYQSQARQKKSLSEIMESSEPAAVATASRLHEYFGRSLATIINSVDPDVIVIGGGVGNIASLYSKGVEEVDRYVFKPLGTPLRTKILAPTLGDSAGVFGAAML